MQAPKSIPDYPNYCISEDSTLYNRKTKNILRPNAQGKVTLYNPYNTRQVGIDRLVAEAFIGSPPNKRCRVTHIDNDRHNCQASNLRWSVKGHVLRSCKCCGKVSVYLDQGTYCPSCMNSGAYKTCDYQLSFTKSDS
jgi:hypothetical protein